MCLNSCTPLDPVRGWCVRGGIFGFKNAHKTLTCHLVLSSCRCALCLPARARRDRTHDRARPQPDPRATRRARAPLPAGQPPRPPRPWDGRGATIHDPIAAHSHFSLARRAARPPRRADARGSDTRPTLSHDRLPAPCAHATIKSIRTAVRCDKNEHCAHQHVANARTYRPLLM